MEKQLKQGEVDAAVHRMKRQDAASTKMSQSVPIEFCVVSLNGRAGLKSLAS